MVLVETMAWDLVGCGDVIRMFAEVWAWIGDRITGDQGLHGDINGQAGFWVHLFTVLRRAFLVPCITAEVFQLLMATLGGFTACFRY